MMANNENCPAPQNQNSGPFASNPSRGAAAVGKSGNQDLSQRMSGEFCQKRHAGKVAGF
jgi:hypothetical protein